MGTMEHLKSIPQVKSLCCTSHMLEFGTIGSFYFFFFGGGRGPMGTLHREEGFPCPNALPKVSSGEEGGGEGRGGGGTLEPPLA